MLYFTFFNITFIYLAIFSDKLHKNWDYYELFEVRRPLRTC